jgi:outer membrane protein OmpA-like peptidoglycan-associated protein
LYLKGTQLLNFDRRRDVFARAVILCPSFVKAHVNLADAYENLGQFEKAEVHYRKAEQLRKDFHIPYVGLAEIYLKTGRFGLAVEAVEQGLAIKPDDERLIAAETALKERLKREKSLFRAEQIRSCLVQDEEFRLMCMCPEKRYAFLRRWVCMPAIFFGTGSFNLSCAARQQLREVAKALQSSNLSDREWLIIGHTDSVGDPDYNALLSKRRALRIKRYLVDRLKVPADILKIDFFGHTRPRSTNDMVMGRAQNRRVEIVSAE